MNRKKVVRRIDDVIESLIGLEVDAAIKTDMKSMIGGMIFVRDMIKDKCEKGGRNK